MTGWKRWMLAAVLAAGLVGPGAARAERGEGERGGAQGEGGEAPPPGHRREKVLKRIEMLRAARLTEELDLDEATAGRLFPLLHRFSERRAALSRERGEIKRQVKAEFGAEKPDPAKVAKHLDRLAALQKDLAGAWTEEYEALKGVLDPIQRARYYKFQKEFEGEVRQLIRDVRRSRTMRREMRERWREERGDGEQGR